MSSQSSSSNYRQYSDNDEEDEMLSCEDDPSSKIGISSEEDSARASLLQKSSRLDKKLQGDPKKSGFSSYPNNHAGVSNGNGPPDKNNGKIPLIGDSFWWIRQKEQINSPNSPDDWRHSKSSISTVYHSAQDLTDFMSEISTTSGETLRSQQSYHSVLKHEDEDEDDIDGLQQNQQEDIFISPTESPLQERKVGKSVAFSMTLADVDFVLVWDSSIEASNTPESIERREIFERNLEEEGLILERENLEGSPYNFLKINAPFEVLRRYSEILKFKMKMKELDDDVVEMVYSPSPEFQLVQIEQTIDNIVGATKSMWEYLTGCFRVNNRIFPEDDNRLSYIYSRDKEYLFDISSPDFFTSTVRGQVVEFILSRKRYTLNNFDDFAFGIERLLKLQVYTAVYPLHDGDLQTPGSARYTLYKQWASLRKCFKFQPLTAIKNYFGVKVGLYFAWLGFYTLYLLPASLLGILCFGYGVITVSSNQLSEDICNSNITMCPLCDKLCDYYQLADTCTYSRVTYLFDNAATVCFAILMSFWSAIYLEMWKRYSAQISHEWDVGDFDVHEEHPRPEYMARLKTVPHRNRNPITLISEPRVPFWKMKLPYTMFSLSMVMFLISLAVAAVMGVVVYRIAVSSALAFYSSKHVEFHSYSLFIVNGSAAIINLVFIFFFNWLYSVVAKKLTEIELHRTQTQYDDALTLKLYLLQFINYYSSILYIAFVKGKFVGTPHKYTTIFGFRQEECAPGGCMTELCLQLAIILVGKQFLNMFTEIGYPMVMKYWNKLKVVGSTKSANRSRVFSTQWAKDLQLLEWDQNCLFNEYLEMVLQYGFITLFVAGFPLAPFFALLNNIFEMRLDAKKMISFYRRPIGSRVRDIGVWFGIMDAIGKLAVISNAFIIAFTSNFIPKLVYMYGIDPNDDFDSNYSLDGFLEHSLAFFNTNEAMFQETRPDAPKYGHPAVCRYQGYRGHYTLPAGERYKRTAFYWKVWMARLAFIVIFENIVAVTVMLLKWLIPDVPGSVTEKVRREAYLTNEIIIKKEMTRARGISCEGDSTGINPLITASDIEMEDMQANEPMNNRNGIRFRHSKGPDNLGNRRSNSSRTSETALNASAEVMV